MVRDAPASALLMTPTMVADMQIVSTFLRFVSVIVLIVSVI